MADAKDESSQTRWLTRGVAGVGLASFFSDSGHEIATSLLPTFITVTLRSTAGALGLIEGISDALMGVAKLVAGPLANDQERRLRMASGGYLVTAAATGAIGLAGTVWQAGIARATAWVARGVRTPPRDAMLASLTPPEAYGRAFGLERAGDNLGAVAGPLLAAALVAWIGVRHTIYLSVIPGLFAALAITIVARESRRLSHACSPTNCAGAASASSEACSLSATSPPPRRSVCSGRRSRRGSVSSTPRVGWLFRR